MSLGLFARYGLTRGAAAPPPPPADVGGHAIYFDSGWANVPLTQNLGWRFTVGANPITVAALRYYHETGATETVRLYRQSDGALIASAGVTSTGGWGTETITPVVLSAATDYVVAHEAGGASRTVYRDAAHNVDPSITYVGSVFGTGTSMPSSSSGNTYVAASFSTAAPTVGYRFYRLLVTANNGGGAIVGALEFGLRTSVSGASVAVSAGGNARASNALTTDSGSFRPGLAFDGSLATNNGWADTTGATAAGKWLLYDFGTAREKVIVEYTVGSYPTGTSTAARSLNAWDFQGSADGETWDTLDTVSGETGWTLGAERAFAL